MVAAVALVVVVALSMMVVRIGSAALALTGLSQDVARFQALSAFSGTGFTTAEAEKVMQHPVRRRIMALLMMLGNAGVISLLGTLVLSFVDVAHDRRQMIERLGLMAAGVLLLYLVARSRWIDRALGRLIRRALRRWTHLEVADYADLLRLANGYLVLELFVEPGDWMTGRTLAELQLNREGVNVMGIRRTDGSYVGSPLGDTQINSGDRLLLYGQRDAVRRLDTRRAGVEGDQDHAEAVRRQQGLVRNQERASEEGPPATSTPAP